MRDIIRTVSDSSNNERHGIDAKRRKNSLKYMECPQIL